jgi:hypothetical protein
MRSSKIADCFTHLFQTVSEIERVEDPDQRLDLILESMCAVMTVFGAGAAIYELKPGKSFITDCAEKLVAAVEKKGNDISSFQLRRVITVAPWFVDATKDKKAEEIFAPMMQTLMRKYQLESAERRAAILERIMFHQGKDAETVN